MSRSGSSGVDEAPAGHCKTCPLTCTTALTQNLEPSELLTAAKMEQARGEGLLLQHCLHESLNSTRHGLVLGKTVGLATKELRFDGLGAGRSLECRPGLAEVQTLPPIGCMRKAVWFPSPFLYLLLHFTCSNTPSIVKYPTRYFSGCLAEGIGWAPNDNTGLYCKVSVGMGRVPEKTSPLLNGLFCKDFY